MSPMPHAASAPKRAKDLAVKKFSFATRCTRRLERYGAALICVHYREIETADDTHRLRAIEPVFDERQAQVRNAWLRIAYVESELRRVIEQLGLAACVANNA